MKNYFAYFRELDLFICKILQFSLLYINFRSNDEGLPCSPDTAKKLAEITEWQPDSELHLKGIPEIFDITHFCKFVKKGFFKIIKIGFARNVSEDYKNAFKAAVDDVKDNWTCPSAFPVFYY